MRELGGRISDRLRKIFHPGAPEWSPPRPGEGAEPGGLRPAVPEHVEGHDVGSRGRGRHWSSDPQRYRVGPWLVAVLTVLLMAAAVVLLVVCMTAFARSTSVVPGRGVSTMPKPCPYPGEVQGPCFR